MTLVKWKPFGDLLSMRNRISRLFEEEFAGDSETGSGSMTSWYPAADIYETEGNYVFKLEVPGLSKDDVKIELNNNTLTIKGEKKEEKEIKKDNFHRVESYSGTFSRNFTLPRDIDANKTEAAMKDGVLELRVAKSEKTKTKAIPITVG